MVNNIKEKTCRKCGQTKPVEDFYENKYSPDGRYAFCKICFDQFAKKLKEREAAVVSLTKTCEKCGANKLIEAFESNFDTPETQVNWCKNCRKQYRELKIQKIKTPEKASPPIKPAKKPKHKIARQQKDNNIKPAIASDQEPADKKSPARNDDFDYIEYLLENQSLEEKMAREILQAPKQITKIKVRKRICNGCGKTEEIDQVEKNTVIPVHAWFCDHCRQRAARRIARKGITVCDYWGREFKVKKVISKDLVMGVLKDKTGKWAKKPEKIYGSWKTV